MRTAPSTPSARLAGCSNPRIGNFERSNPVFSSDLRSDRKTALNEQTSPTPPHPPRNLRMSSPTATKQPVKARPRARVLARAARSSLTPSAVDIDRIAPSRRLRPRRTSRLAAAGSRATPSGRRRGGSRRGAAWWAQLRRRRVLPPRLLPTTPPKSRPQRQRRTHTRRAWGSVARWGPCDVTWRAWAFFVVWHLYTV